MLNYMLKEISSPRKRGSGLFPFRWSPVLVRVANSSGRERNTFFVEMGFTNLKYSRYENKKVKLYENIEILKSQGTHLQTC